MCQCLLGQHGARTVQVHIYWKIQEQGYLLLEKRCWMIVGRKRIRYEVQSTKIFETPIRFCSIFVSLVRQANK